MAEPTPVESLAFEQAVAELEAIVTELERGDVALEESIARFERGMALARRCEDRLNEAERKVVLLLERGGVRTEVPLDPGTDRS